MTTDLTFDIRKQPVHLGLGATVCREPAFTGVEWYAAYGARHEGDGVEGRLVSVHTFAEPWGTWEMHPKGEELVVCLAGRIVLHQEVDGQVRTVALEAHQAVVNPAGVWHTADVGSEATALFITAGLGTEIRPR